MHARSSRWGKLGEKWGIAGIGHNIPALSTLRCVVVMVDVVVSVKIYRRTIDKAVAKEHVLSEICTAFLAAHVRVTACTLFLLLNFLYLGAIFPTTPTILFNASLWKKHVRNFFGGKRD